MHKFYKEYSGIKDFETSVYKEFSQYKNIVFGVVSTNQPDLIGDCIDDKELGKLCDQICKYGLALNIRHDIRIPPIGNTISAKIFKSNYDNKKLAIYAAMALFSEKHYSPLPEIIVNGENELENSDFSYNEKIELGFDNYETINELMSKILSDAPEFVSRQLIKEFRKSIDPIITLITLAIPTGIIITKYAEKQVETINQIQKEFLSWLKNSVCKKINKTILYRFTNPYKGCEVNFVVETKDPELLGIAFGKLNETLPKARLIIDHLENEFPIELVYVFDHEKPKRWLPSYVKTVNNKIFTDKPYLMSIEELKNFGGLSIAGSHG
jgi:hypothetical protein